MVGFFDSPSGRRLAYRKESGNGPGFMWLSGFNSNIQGTKVLALEAWARVSGHPFLAFDYSGHGLSDGVFADGAISQWREDALDILSALADGPQILVASSMGAWIAVLLALAVPERVAGLIMIAPAPDFTEKLLWSRLNGDAQQEIMNRGIHMMPSNYGDPYPITKSLIEDGRKWQVLDGPIRLDVPVRIFQGGADPEVPMTFIWSFVEALTTNDLVLTYIRDADHRLSREEDTMRLTVACEEICQRI